MEGVEGRSRTLAPANGGGRCPRAVAGPRGEVSGVIRPEEVASTRQPGAKFVAADRPQRHSGRGWPFFAARIPGQPGRAPGLLAVAVAAGAGRGGRRRGMAGRHPLAPGAPQSLGASRMKRQGRKISCDVPTSHPSSGTARRSYAHAYGSVSSVPDAMVLLGGHALDESL